MKGLKVKVGMGFVVGLTLCLVVASGAWALGLSLTGDPSWSLQNISPESSHESTTEWTVENTGDEAEDISISVANSANWQPAADTTIENKFVLDHNAYSPTIPWKNITTGGVSLKDNLPASGTKDFKLQFTAPKSGSVGSQQTIIATLSANNQWYSGPIALDVVPNKGIKPNISGINIIGSGFAEDATVWLKKDSTEIQATLTTYNSSESLTADFTFGGTDPTGGYTIEVVNPTGDVSPCTMQDGTDCFFGAATDDATNWTGTAADLACGKKLGNSSLETVDGSYCVDPYLTCLDGACDALLTWSGEGSPSTHKESDCEMAGGVRYDTGSTGTICKFTGSNLVPPDGWAQAENWQKFQCVTGGDVCSRWKSPGPCLAFNNAPCEYFTSVYLCSYDMCYAPAANLCDSATSYWHHSGPATGCTSTAGAQCYAAVTRTESDPADENRIEIGCY